VNVLDVAKAHVAAMELPAAANERFLLAAGQYNNRLIVEVIRKRFPEYKDALPSQEVKGGDYPADGTFKIGNEKSKEVLGIQYKEFEQTIVDTVNSFKAA
jgi:nucleoside-diphosphate-sugar epimerase